MAKRKANAQWNGTLKGGKGTMIFSNYSGPYTYKSRFEEGDGTNPEELVGAAIAGCFSMFLSALISEENLEPEYVKTEATVHLEKDDTGPVIATIALNSSVKCEGIAKDKFDELVDAAIDNCPVSRLYASAEKIVNADLI